MPHNTVKDFLERTGMVQDRRKAGVTGLPAQFQRWILTDEDDGAVYELLPEEVGLWVDIKELGSTEGCLVVLPIVAETQRQLLYIVVEGLGAGETCTVVSGDMVASGDDLDYAGFGFWTDLVLTPGTDLTGSYVDASEDPSVTRKFSMVLCYNTGFGWIIVTSCYPWGWPQI